MSLQVPCQVMFANLAVGRTITEPEKSVGVIFRAVIASRSVSKLSGELLGREQVLVSGTR